jgi:sugar lactone lactonase YvrE
VYRQDCRHPIGARLCIAIAAVSICCVANSWVALAGEITLLAGANGETMAADGAVAIARFKGPQGIAADRAGNIFVTDGHAIRKVSALGEVTTLAGRAEEWGTTDGLGGTARFNNPQGLAVDAAGNVYVADRDNQCIRKITPSGMTTTLAGSATSSGSADGLGSAARFWRPTALAVGATGIVYVADTRNFTIRRISPAGAVTTLAGRPEPSVRSLREYLTYLKGAGAVQYIDGPASVARFGTIEGIAVDQAGNVFVADYTNHVIRKISAAGVVSTVAGRAGAVGSVDGTGADARFFYPSGIAADLNGNLYVADSHAGIVRRISPSGVVTTIAGLANQLGNVDGRGSDARFYALHALALDQQGKVLLTDYASLPGSSSTSGYYEPPGPSGTVRRIDVAGNVSTIAGRATEAEGSIDGAANVARFKDASGIAVGARGTLLVTDLKAGTIRRIDAAGEVTTTAGKADVHGQQDGPGADARFRQPTNIAVDSTGVVYVTDPVASVVRRISPDGIVTTWAGRADVKGSADGPGSVARFRTPTGIAVDKYGTVFISDEWDDVIRRITPTGEVSTFAGRAGQRGSADGPVDVARFNVPAGLAVDALGNLYVCDFGNRTIRKITPQGQVSTAAGKAGTREPAADGTGPAARFSSPLGVAADRLGNLYVADAYTVRRITPAGVVTTIAGVSEQPGIKLGRTPGRLDIAEGVAVIDSNTLAVTQGKAVVKITLDSGAAAN